jgi:hypothetical protein
MPTRYIKYTICQSRTLDALTAEEECLFYRLIVTVDDFGRYHGDPKLVLAACYPLRIGRMAPEDVDALLDGLHRAGLIVRYTASDEPYLYLVTWLKHQNTRAKVSRFPEPSADTCIQSYTSADNRIQMSTSVAHTDKDVPVIVSVSVSETVSGEGADAPALGLVMPEASKPDHFATFWAIKCHRGGSSKKESLKLWQSYFAQPPAMRYSEEQVIAARQRYADATDPRYYSLTEVWLRQEKWETFVGDGYTAPACTPSTPPVDEPRFFVPGEKRHA